jgi:hypothetical protein
MKTTQAKPINVINTRTVFNQNLDCLIETSRRNNRRNKNNNDRQYRDQKKYERMARDYYSGV